MPDLIAGVTALPNLHPALVHFPLALFPAAVFSDIASLSLKAHRSWLDRAAALLYFTAAVGAGVAYWAGRWAADSLPPTTLEVQIGINEHADAALTFLWLAGILAVVRLLLSIKDHEFSRVVFRTILVIIALAGVGLVLRAGELGGALVYRHGVGVSGRPAEVVDEPGIENDRATAASRLETEDNGSVVWRPIPGDREALGTILVAAPGSDTSHVAWIEPDGHSSGLRLSFDGEAVLVLPGLFGDVVVEAELELEGFEGEIGLAHHVRSATEAGFLVARLPAGEFSVGAISPAGTRYLDRSVQEVPSGFTRLTISAVGRHFNGYLDDLKVVHGHEAPLKEGACGLIARGRGILGIRELKVTPNGS